MKLRSFQEGIRDASQPCRAFRKRATHRLGLCVLERSSLFCFNRSRLCSIDTINACFHARVPCTCSMDNRLQGIHDPFGPGWFTVCSRDSVCFVDWICFRNFFFPRVSDLVQCCGARSICWVASLHDRGSTPRVFPRTRPDR